MNDPNAGFLGYKLQIQFSSYLNSGNLFDPLNKVILFCCVQSNSPNKSTAQGCRKKFCGGKPDCGNSTALISNINLPVHEVFIVHMWFCT